MTVVFTSHLMDESARADRVGIMSGGRLAAVDAPARLLAGAGPEILRVATANPSAVSNFLHAECGLAPHSLEGEVRASASDAHAIAARLSAALPAEIDSTTISKPSLEDVFLFKTGKRLND
jgi:ABC-2 type transport system ATP-binding protein